MHNHPWTRKPISSEALVEQVQNLEDLTEEERALANSCADDLEMHGKIGRISRFRLLQALSKRKKETHSDDPSKPPPPACARVFTDRQAEERDAVKAYDVMVAEVRSKPPVPPPLRRPR